MSIIIFLIILNILFINSAFLGVILGAVYFFIYGKKLGRWLFSNFPLLAKERSEPALSDSRMGEVFQSHSLDYSANQRTIGIFFLLSFFSLAGAIIYYLYKLNNLIIIFFILAAPYIINRLNEKWPAEEKAGFINMAFQKWLKRIFFIIFHWGNLKKIFRDKTQKSIFSFEFLYLITFIVLAIILHQSATVDAIRSPWLIVPKYFFVLYIFATILLITIIRKSEKPSLPFIILHFFLSSSIALIIYKLGYGFDPFIHQATEKVIFGKGIITPKPFYYLGQYSLVVILAKIFQISVSTIDKLLVPILFSVFVPFFGFLGIMNFVFYRRRHVDMPPSMQLKYAELSVLALLILPFTSFIATTPQSLANVYALIIIFLSLSTSRGAVSEPEADKYKPRLQKYILVFLAATTMAIHPLTGIPVAIFVGLYILLNPLSLEGKAGVRLIYPTDNLSPTLSSKGGMRKTISLKKILQLCLIFAISSIIIPLTFYVNSKISNASQVSISSAVEVQNFKPLQARQYNFIRDFIYLYGFNYILIFLIISIVGIVLAKFPLACHDFMAGDGGQGGGKRWIEKLISIPLPYLLTFLILIVNYLILKNFVKFNSLIFYEQGDYAERLLMLSLYFLLPFFLYAFYSFFEKLFNHCRNEELPRLYRAQFSMVFFLSFFALWITASLYLTYPRYDNYVSSSGFNASESDFKAVAYINENAKFENYIVLANQNTSAAALAKYGFLKYYDNCKGAKFCTSTVKSQIFYYPIPTSSPLYEYYLSMVNTKPLRKTIRNAMEYAGVEEAYFVVSNYWWKADQIIENAKLEADKWEKIDDGKAYIFKYLR